MELVDLCFSSNDIIGLSKKVIKAMQTIPKI